MLIAVTVVSGGLANPARFRPALSWGLLSVCCLVMSGQVGCRRRDTTGLHALPRSWRADGWL